MGAIRTAFCQIIIIPRNANQKITIQWVRVRGRKRRSTRALKRDRMSKPEEKLVSPYLNFRSIFYMSPTPSAFYYESKLTNKVSGSWHWFSLRACFRNVHAAAVCVVLLCQYNLLSLQIFVIVYSLYSHRINKVTLLKPMFKCSVILKIVC